MSYDGGKNYFDCLKQILIEKRNHSRPEIEKRFPLFVAKFPETIEILFKKKVEINDVMKNRQTHMYDGRTFIESIYFLLTETEKFDAVGKRSSPTTMGLWTGWYEQMMRDNPQFYDAFRVLMRKICEGRLANDSVACVQVASIDMAHRGVITHKQRSDLLNDFITRKGIYSDTISKFKITEDEWNKHIQEFLAKETPTPQ